MVDPILDLALVGVAGLTPSAAIFGLRRRDARAWADGLVPHRLVVPSGCDPGALQRFFGSLTGLLPARWERPFAVRGVGIEVASSSGTIVFYLLIPASQTDIVTGQLRANLPSARLTPEPSYWPETPTLAGELVTASPHHQLEVDQPGSVAMGILASLQPLDQGEHLTIQMLLMPLAPGTQPPDETALSGWSRLWGGEASKRPAESSKAVREKYGNPPLFAATIRLAAISASPGRDRQLLARVTASYHGANGPDATLRRRSVSSRQVSRAFLRRRPPLLNRPCLLNAAEVTAIAAFPPPNVALPGLFLGGSRLLPASNDIPRTGIPVAISNYPGSNRPLCLSVLGAQQHVLITGPPGTGKSSLIGNMIQQAMELGYCVIVVDPKRDLVEDVIGLVPENRIDDTIIFDALDGQPIGLNIFQSFEDNVDLVGEQVYEILRKLNPDSWGPRLGDNVRTFAHTLARTPGSTICDVIPLLTDSTFRAKVIGDLDDPLGLSGYWSWFNAQSEGERSQIIAPVLNKIRPLTVRTSMRHVLGQATPLLDIDEVLLENRILLAPLSPGELGGDASALLSSVLLSKLFSAVMRRVRLPRAERRPIFIFIDEAPVLGKLPTPLADMLAMARAMGTSVVMAHQTLSQFDTELKAAVLGAARSRVLFQMGSDDATRFAKDLSPHLGPEDLRGLAPFEVVCSLATGQRVAPPATGRTRPMPPDNGRADIVRERSRQRWGRDRDEVEAELRRRQEHPTVPAPVGRQRRST